MRSKSHWEALGDPFGGLGQELLPAQRTPAERSEYWVPWMVLQSDVNVNDRGRGHVLRCNVIS